MINKAVEIPFLASDKRTQKFPLVLDLVLWLKLLCKKTSWNPANFLQFNRLLEMRSFTTLSSIKSFDDNGNLR